MLTYGNNVSVKYSGNPRVYYGKILIAEYNEKTHKIKRIHTGELPDPVQKSVDSALSWLSNL